MCVESARPIRSANGRVPGTAILPVVHPLEAYEPVGCRPILSGCRVWAPVIVSRRIGNSPRNLDCLPVVFFSQSRPRPPPCHIGSPPRFGFSTVDPPTCTRSIWRKKKVEFQKTEIPKTRRNSQGSCKQARYRESGLGQRVVPRLCVRPTRGREKLGKTLEKPGTASGG